MPGRKQVRGAGLKEQRQYEHIKKSPQRSARYGKRARAVAVPHGHETAQAQGSQKGSVDAQERTHAVAHHIAAAGLRLAYLAV